MDDTIERLHLYFVVFLLPIQGEMTTSSRSPSIQMASISLLRYKVLGHLEHITAGIDAFTITGKLRII